MGLGREYREVVTAEFHRDEFEKLCIENNLINGSDYNIKIVNIPDYDYSQHQEWVKQKAISDKAYKELKRIEFQIRNK